MHFIRTIGQHQIARNIAIDLRNQKEMAPSFRKSRARFLITSVETCSTDSADTEIWNLIHLIQLKLNTACLLTTGTTIKNRLAWWASTSERSVLHLQLIKALFACLDKFCHSTCSAFIIILVPKANWYEYLWLRAKCSLLEFARAKHLTFCANLAIRQSLAFPLGGIKRGRGRRRATTPLLRA